MSGGVSAQTSAVASFGLARSSVLSGPVASPRECSFLLEASVHAATAQTAAWDDQQQRRTALRWLLASSPIASASASTAAPLSGCCKAAQFGARRTPCFRPREGIRAEPARRPGKRGKQGRRQQSTPW